MSAGGTTTNTISKLHCYNFETQTDITASTQMDINIYIESLLLQAKDMNVTKSLSHSVTCFLVVLQPKGYTRTPTEAWWSLSLPFGRVKHEKIEVPQQDNQCFRNCLKMCNKYLMYTDCTALQCYSVTVLQCYSVTSLTGATQLVLQDSDGLTLLLFCSIHQTVKTFLTNYLLLSSNFPECLGIKSTTYSLTHLNRSDSHIFLFELW